MIAPLSADGRGERTAAGFTLLELLVALTLLAVVMSFLVSGLRLGARTWNAGVARSEQAEEFRTTYRVLRQMLGSMRADIVNAGGQPEYVFAGEARRMRFVAALPQSAVGQGYHVIWLQEVEQDDGAALRLYWRPFGGSEAELPEQDDEQSAELVGGLQKVSFSYFQSAGPGQNEAWLDGWESKDDLPVLVRVDLRGVRGIDWPEIVVPIRVEAERDCVLPVDQPLRKCRLDAR